MIGFLPEFLMGASALWGVFVGTATAGAMGLAAYDRFFSRDPMSRRYPLFGRFLPFIDNWVGKFWRVHIDSADREGMPYNRAQIGEIKGLSDTGKPNKVPFGSSKDLEKPGNITIDNCQFPPLAERFSQAASLVIGPDCEKPFDAKSVFNIS